MALGDYRGPSLMRAFVGYVAARWAARVEEKAYRSYVTDSLRLIPQMSYFPTRFAEAVGWVRTDERTADEIADDVIARLEACDEPT